MAKRDVIKAKNLLFQLFRRRNIYLNKIIFFGSYAKNAVNPHSDIDIIVVSKDFRGKDIFERVGLANGISTDIMRAIHKPVDMLYYSDKEWEKGHSIIAHTAKNEGLIFYR